MSWQGVDFAHKKSSAESSCVEFKQRHELMLDYLRTIKCIVDEQKVMEETKKRNMRRIKVGICGKLVDGGAPPSYAQLIASYLEQRGPDHTHTSHEINAAGGSGAFGSEYTNTSSFTSPCCFLSPSDPDDGPTYYHKLLAKAFNDNGRSADERLAGAVESFNPNRKQVVLTTPLHPYTLSLNNPNASTTAFSTPGNFSPYVVALRPMTFSHKMSDAQPLGGLGFFFYRFVRSSHIHVVQRQRPLRFPVLH